MELVNPAASRFIVSLLGKRKGYNVSELSKLSRVSYNQVLTLMKKFNTEGLISYEQRLREKYMYLTIKGIDIARELTIIQNSIGNHGKD